MITLLVTGGRTYANTAKLEAVLDRILKDNPGLRLVHGGCGADGDDPVDPSKFKGADGLAHVWATKRGLPIRVYAARWKALGKPGGPERNARMLRMEPVSLGVAFPGGPGTANMIGLIRTYDLPLIIIT